MRNAKITITPNETDEQYASITMEGDLTLQNAEQIKQNLVQALKQYQYLSLNIENVENIDLPFIQLLYALKKTVVNSGKELQIAALVPEDLQLILEHSGFDKGLRL